MVLLVVVVVGSRSGSMDLVLTITLISFVVDAEGGFGLDANGEGCLLLILAV